MKVSLQLWSLFKDGVTDLEELLKLSSEMEYDGVELLKHDVTADEMNALLKKYNLYAKSAHIGMEFFENNLEEMLEFHKNIGAEYMIIPWMGYEDKSNIKRVIDVLNKASETAKKYGIKVGYHNHAQEFEKVDGKYILDILYENTNEDVVFELDVFWVYVGGADPAEMIKKYGKRAELIHLKQSDENKNNVDLPDGVIDMKNVIETAKYAKYFVVEQEEYKKDSYTSCRADVDYLKGLMK